MTQVNLQDTARPKTERVFIFPFGVVRALYYIKGGEAMFNRGGF
jgi:hypothetical protein